MRSNNFSENDLKAAFEDLTVKDNPLTRDKLKALLTGAGWSWQETYHDHGFGVYSCTRN